MALSPDQLHVAAIDIGAPGKNLGWSILGPRINEDGSDLDECILVLADALREGPLALGFEAPLFVPARSGAVALTRARAGECVGGVNRPFSAGAGASVLVTALVVVPYLLSKLRSLIPHGRATLDWETNLGGNASLLIFEAFVTNQRKTGARRHIDDARAATEAFQRMICSDSGLRSAVSEPRVFSLVGAMLLHSGWAADTAILTKQCLVVKAG